MKIYKWLNNQLSSINGVAIVEVEPYEVADIDKMVVLLEGDCVGHFGYYAELVSTGKPPEMETLRGRLRPKPQFGYERYSVEFGRTRYYKIFVNRD